jgi:hypothetical protein
VLSDFGQAGADWGPMVTRNVNHRKVTVPQEVLLQGWSYLRLSTEAYGLSGELCNFGCSVPFGHGNIFFLDLPE